MNFKYNLNTNFFCKYWTFQELIRKILICTWAVKQFVKIEEIIYAYKACFKVKQYKSHAVLYTEGLPV